VTDATPNFCVAPGCGQELPAAHRLAAGYGQDEQEEDRTDAEVVECPSCHTELHRTGPSDPWQLRLP
jgi:hypothetical protein